MSSFKIFLLSFVITASILIPMVFGVYKLAEWQDSTSTPEQVTQSESNILVSIPKAQHDMDILFCVVGEKVSFNLISLNATSEKVYISSIPAEGVLVQGDETPSLAQSYAAAGPARVLELLNSTLGLKIEKYIAISESNLKVLLNGELGNFRAGLSGVLSDSQLKFIGNSGEVQNYTIEQVFEFLNKLSQKSVNVSSEISPVESVHVATNLIEAWWRAKQEFLPAKIPTGLRELSSSLLTNFSAMDLFTLEETLEFLANDTATVTPIFVSGDWNKLTGRFEFNDETLVDFEMFM